MLFFECAGFEGARFISESLGKTMAWEGKTNTVGICEKSQYNKVNELIIKWLNPKVLQIGLIPFAALKIENKLM